MHNNSQYNEYATLLHGGWKQGHVVLATYVSNVHFIQQHSCLIIPNAILVRKLTQLRLAILSVNAKDDALPKSRLPLNLRLLVEWLCNYSCSRRGRVKMQEYKCGSFIAFLLAFFLQRRLHQSQTLHHHPYKNESPTSELLRLKLQCDGQTYEIQNALVRQTADTSVTKIHDDQIRTALSKLIRELTVASRINIARKPVPEQIQEIRIRKMDKTRGLNSHANSDSLQLELTPTITDVLI